MYASTMTPLASAKPSPPTTVACDPVHMVTWYMWDALSFSSLVTLLTSHASYMSSVEKLELVAPCSSIEGNAVSKTTLLQLTHWIVTSPSLQEVVLFTLLPRQPELELVRQLERACHKAHLLHGCTIKSLDDAMSQVELLCDCLSPDNRAGKRRHLALDGALLHNISQAELQQLAFDLSWDRSIHVLLLKDLSNSHLTLLVPKLVPGPLLHTLKITYDPHSGNRRLQDGTILAASLPWKELLTDTTKRPSSLQRLYLGHVRFTRTNTRPLLEACQQSTSLKKLDLCLCQFESGTGHLWQELLTTLRKQQQQQQQQQQQTQPLLSLRDIEFHYPIITKPTTTSHR
jgi:hypothetical protein